MDVDLQACCAGDGASWEVFVRRYAGVIAAAVRRVLGGGSAGGAGGRVAGGAGGGVAAGEDEVSDCIQDVFVRLVSRDFALLKSYDPKRASLPTWLTLVARSTAIDRVRRVRAGMKPLTLQSAPAPVAPATSNGPAEAVTAEIPMHLLTARQQLIMKLLFDEEMSVPQAAAFVGVDEQTIRSMKNKALTRLRRHLGVKGMPNRGAPVPQEDR